MKRTTVLRILFTVFIVLFNCRQVVYSQENTIQISLLTYSPGNKLYSVFGHSAIRVKNNIKNTDEVYNYGTFDFNEPSFYFGFVRGKLIYKLSRLPFDIVLQQVKIENRSLIETPLNLSPYERSKIVRLLEVNYMPENREYLYDFFYNNCSSKIIDLISESVSDTLEFNQLIVPKKSYRKLLNDYLKERPWTDAGADLLMGFPADKRVRGTTISFLPDYLHLLLKNIRIKEEFGFQKSLAQSDIVHFNFHDQSSKPAIQPAIILWSLVLVLLISQVFGTYIPGFFRILEKSILVIFGFLGLIILLLWLLTDHYIFNFNTDLLWANPLLLVLAFMKDSVNQIKFRVILTYLVTLFVIAGIFTTIIVERNFNLTAVSVMTVIILVNRIYVYRKTDNDPFSHK